MIRPDLIEFAATSAERYLTLNRIHPSHTYNYEARGYFNFPVFEHERHGPKCGRGQTWLYFAIPDGANPARLGTGQRLYVGAQTQDRMFRGDGFKENFHHHEMRSGRDDDTPSRFLGGGARIAIYRVDAQLLARRVEASSDFGHLHVLLTQPHTPKCHLGWYFEQSILHAEFDKWRWNSRRADAKVARVLERAWGMRAGC